MVCSDGGGFAIDGASRRGSPHPRGLGTFPRVLGRYVRERKALTLEQAVRKMSALPAARVRLGDRGRIAANLPADLVVFDPATVADKATFEEPFQYPVGIQAVVVNGQIAFPRSPAHGGAGRRSGQASWACLLPFFAGVRRPGPYLGARNRTPPMRLRLTTFGITIAALVIAPSARAQVTLRTTGYEARDALTDFVHIWVSPFRAERRDWIAAMGVAAGAIALVPIDDQIDEWIVNHPNSAFRCHQAVG